MIKTEMIGNRIRHYSDIGMKIRQIETDILYEEATDVLPLRYSYEETDIPIDPIDEEATIEDYEAALAELGVR